jgi:hypothetical protein
VVVIVSFGAPHPAGATQFPLASGKSTNSSAPDLVRNCVVVLVEEPDTQLKQYLVIVRVWNRDDVVEKLHLPVIGSGLGEPHAPHAQFDQALGVDLLVKEKQHGQENPGRPLNASASCSSEIDASASDKSATIATVL